MKPYDYGAAVEGPYEDHGEWYAELTATSLTGATVLVALSMDELSALYGEISDVLEKHDDIIVSEMARQALEDEQEAKASW